MEFTMKNSILTAFMLITILVFTILGRTEARPETAITLRAGDGAALGLTFNTFPAWIGRIEAIGRLKTSEPYRVAGSEVKLRDYSLGGQGTIFWQVHFLKDLTIQIAQQSKYRLFTMSGSPPPLVTILSLPKELR